MPKKQIDLNSILKVVLIIFILSVTILAITKFDNDGKGFSDQKDQSVITVSGHGEMNVKPDTTKFTISVTGSGKDIKSSQEVVNGKMKLALDILKQKGIEDKNIKTLNYDTYPKYASKSTPCGVIPMGSAASSVATPAIYPLPPDNISGGTSGGSAGYVGCINNSSEIVGYETSQSIEVKITNIDKNPDLAGTLITAVGKVGVQTGGLTNFVDNLDQVKQQVRDQAVQKAKAEALNIAKSLGVRLGKVTSFSENSGGIAYPMMLSAKAVGSADSSVANLPTGENKVSSDVSVSYSVR